MRFVKPEERSFAVGLLIILAYMRIVYYGGDDSYGLIHDNLDSFVANYRLISFNSYLGLG